MFHRQANEYTRLAAVVDFRAQAVADALSRRKAEMAKAWTDLDKGWQGLEANAAKLGLRKASTPEEDVVCLNVGGLRVSFRRSVFQGENGSFPTCTLAKLLAGGEWDARVPRDADGLIVLDESPACVSHIIHALTIKASRAASSSRALHDALPADEKPYLPHVSRALGLPKAVPPPFHGTLEVSGGSTILDPKELGAILEDWLPLDERMELVYRASRDGWEPEDFHAKCNDDSPRTVTLCRVMDQRTGRGCSVVGGFSSVSWAPIDDDEHPATSSDAFIFMLKRGIASEADPFEPVKWDIKNPSQAVTRGDELLPHFGMDDLAIHGPPAARIRTDRVCYEIPADHAILFLDGNTLLEVEVFRVSDDPAPPPPPAKRTRRTLPDLIDREMCPVRAMSAQEADDDVSKFGADIAGALLEERMALDAARAELIRAVSRAGKSVMALAEMYGPDVADGKEDPIVELSVGGTRMTTLRSTLQACPDSALAARCDDAKWPATEKEVDAHGRRLIEGSPSVFSKVLDVLRMRKRTAWAVDCARQGWSEPVRVGIKAADRAAFEQFVEMYFPGRQSFIMDCVESKEESLPPPKA